MDESETSITAGPLAAPAVSEAEERFELWRKRLGFVLAPLAFALVFALASGLPYQGRALAATLAGVAVLWMTESLPLPATALLGALLCVVLKVDNLRDVLTPFADPIVFLFIGSFILAQAMSLHGLDRRLALAFLSMRWVGGKPLRVLAAMGFAVALLSMWVSNTATTAMMTPIALGILRAMHQMHREAGVQLPPLRSWPFASAMMLMVAYGASVGGIGTPVGSPPNLIALGQLREIAKVEVSFFTWTAIMVPMMVLMMIGLTTLLAVLHPQPAAPPQLRERLDDYIAEERGSLGAWTPGQIHTVIAFGIACTLWIVPGVLSAVMPEGDPVQAFFDRQFPESMVALGAALLLFVLPTNLREGKFAISWEEAVRIDWGTIILFGGGLTLGNQMFKTGVAKELAEGMIGIFGTPSIWTLTAGATLLGILISEAASNTASASMIIPAIIAMAQQAEVNPIPPTLGACLGASFGFMLPVSTPPNAIVYGTGMVPIWRMLRAGILFDILGFFLILAGLRILCPLLGLS
ncbi:MAG: DASS family sodium-coupled anion symporter [Gemmataceae bacterium]|nr:DASS family sodium-coupled anion symporter [Gemmataceae bacterium]